MSSLYDKYYQTPDLFGAPYPALITFLSNYSKKGKLLDVGCGQGRDAIPLARLGYEVVGMDNSKIGIAQMNRIAQTEQLNLTGMVADIYTYDNFSAFDFILFDSMFHFAKKEKKKETDFIKKVVMESKQGAILIFCLQDVGKKVQVLRESIDFGGKKERVYETNFTYEYEDKSTKHFSKTNYKMIVYKNVLV